MQLVLLRLIGWIVIYPVDSAIKPLNNQGLFWYKTNNIRSTITVKSSEDRPKLRTVLWVLKIDTKQTNEQTIRPMRGNPKQSLDSGLFHAVDSRFQIPIVRGIPNSFSLRASFLGALWRRGGKGAIPHLFERLFLIGWENNRDCHITMPYPWKQWKCRLNGTSEIRGIERCRFTGKKEGEYATMSLEFEFHLQFTCGSPSIELSDFR